jgi:hypothetical protein
MIDLKPPPVPELSEERIDSHRSALLESIGDQHHPTAKWAILSGGTIAVAASVSAALMVGGSGQAPVHLAANSRDVFLRWSASPTTPAIGQLTAADTSCGSSLQLPPINEGTIGVSLVPELSDVRGPFTVTVFGNGTQNEALCMSTSDASSSVQWIDVSATSPSPGAIVVDKLSTGALDGQPYTLVVGRTGTGVTGVTLSLANGDDVTTTSGNGLFVAWWPGSQSIASASVATASGVSTQTSNLAGPANPPSTKPAPPPGAHVSPGYSGNSTVCLIRSCG